MKLKIIFQIIIKIVLPGFILYFGILNFFINFGYSSLNIIKDNKDILGKGIVYGLISNIGITLWLATAIIIFIRILKKNSKLKKFNNLYLLGLISSTWLFFLDLFDFHNSFLQDFHYSLLILLSTSIFFNGIFLKVKFYNLFTLIFSYVFLGISVLIDKTQAYNFFIELGIEKTQVIEEAFKFVGILLWLNFWLRITKYIRKKSINY